MTKGKILIVWSNYYEELAGKQLNSCTEHLAKLGYEYTVETVDAGVYEIPITIKYYHTHNPYDGYLPLGLLIKGSTDHYEFIWQHIKECFIKFTMDGLLIGNGIITAPNTTLLQERVENHERVQEAVQAIDYLLKMKARLLHNSE